MEWLASPKPVETFPGLTRKATPMKTPSRSLSVLFALGLAVAACGGASTVENAGDSEAAEAARAAEEALSAVEALEDEISELSAELGGTGGHPETLAMIDDTTIVSNVGDGHDYADSGAHWSYEGVTGAHAWGRLNQQFAVCEAGMEQSPIDIPMMGTMPVGLDDLQVDWSPTTLTMINNGHTIQANVPPGNTTIIDNVPFQMLQFHFHKPSEHTVQGEVFPMELHFVHADAAGNLGVVGVLLAEGLEAHPAYDILWRNQPVAGDQLIIENFDMTTLLPDNLNRWRYNGSLTTPPCSEGVNWNVLSMPTFMSRSQIASFLYDGNARPTLPINERDVLRDQS